MPNQEAMEKGFKAIMDEVTRIRERGTITNKADRESINYIESIARYKFDPGTCEYPAILQRGESVLTPAQMKAMGRAGKPGTVR